jgi:hypothetical protein
MMPMAVPQKLAPLSFQSGVRKRLCCGPSGHHEASYGFFELPIRLVRNNHHVWQHLIPIQLALMTM